MRRLLTIFVITVLILGSFGLSAANADTPDMDGYAIIVGSSGKSYLVEGESEIYTAFVFNSKHEYIDPTELNFTWGMNSYGLVRFNNKDGNTCEIVADNNGLFNLTLIVEGDTVARGGIQIPIIDKEFKIDEKIHMKLLVELSKMSPCNPPCRIEVKSGAECITVRTGEDKHLKDDNFVFYRYVSGCTDPCFFSSGVSKNKFRLEVRDKCDNTGSTIERDDNNEESIFHAGNTPGTCSVAAYYNGSMLKSLLCIKVVDEDNASVVTPKELYFKDVPRWGINPIAKKFNFKSEKLAHIRVKCVDEWVEISPSEYYTGMETNF